MGFRVRTAARGHAGQRSRERVPQAAPGAAADGQLTIAATGPALPVRSSTYQETETHAPRIFTYDPNGNLTQKTDPTGVWAYTWNAENQLVRVTKDGAEIATFAYDPLGRRVEKAAGGVTASFAYDREDVLRELRQGTAPSRFVHGPRFDEPLAMDDGASPIWLHADGLGSAVSTTNQAGVVVSIRGYDGWGDPEQTSDDGYAFTGREWDSSSRLYYYRARYYDPRLARFLSEDPIGLLGGLHRYSYVHDDPIDWVDPSGLRDGKTGWSPANYDFDYVTVNCQALFFSGSLSYVIGGHSFSGSGVGFPKGCGCYVALGKLDGPKRPPKDVGRFMNGFSANASAYLIVGAGKTTASGMTATEAGFGLALGIGGEFATVPTHHGCPSDSCYDRDGRLKK